MSCSQLGYLTLSHIRQITKSLRIQWLRTGLNRRPHAPQAYALPTELQSHNLYGYNMSLTDKLIKVKSCNTRSGSRNRTCEDLSQSQIGMPTYHPGLWILIFMSPCKLYGGEYLEIDLSAGTDSTLTISLA